jgi:hypothetical protein
MAWADGFPRGEMRHSEPDRAKTRIWLDFAWGVVTLIIEAAIVVHVFAQEFAPTSAVLAPSRGSAVASTDASKGQEG